MKNLIFAAFAVATFASFAAPTENKPKLTKEEREQRIMEKVGGFIVTEGKGSLAVVNAQKGFDVNQITNSTTLVSRNLQMPLAIKEGSFAIADARKTLDGLGATIGVFLIDDPAMPMSLTSTEAGWGVVNIAPLKDGADGEKLAKRVAKEFNRVLMFTLGGGLSSQKTSIMKPITKPADLDKCVNVWIPFDTLGVVFNNMSGYGLVRATRTTYRKACQDGWAPEPTNDFQKVIWEQVHAKPTNPMKIKFDPKKGE